MLYNGNMLTRSREFAHTMYALSFKQPVGEHQVEEEILFTYIVEARTTSTEFLNDG
jgi:hypothetical protein